MEVAVFYAVGEEYRRNMKFWLHNSVSSFKKWHPEIEVLIVENDDNFDMKQANRYIYIQKLFESGYTRVILLGIDTITTGRMTELLEDTKTTIIGTLDGSILEDECVCEHKIFTSLRLSVTQCENINTDIIVFNNVYGVLALLYNMKMFPDHNDQYAMNMMNKHTNLIKCICFPSVIHESVYNMPALGNLGWKSFREDGVYVGFDGPRISHVLPTKLFTKRGDILFNHQGKHTKCIHFTADLKFLFNMLFTEEIREFFVEHCNCDLTLELPKEYL